MDLTVDNCDFDRIQLSNKYFMIHGSNGVGIQNEIPLCNERNNRLFKCAEQTIQQIRT